MKAIIMLLVAFAALVSVKCDERSLQELKDHYQYVYTYLTDAVTKTRVENNAKLICTIIRKEAEGLKGQELDYMADVYEKKAKFIEDNLPKVWPILDKEDDNTRRFDYIFMGVEFELIAYDRQLMSNTTANHTVEATDTEDNLHKKFTQLSTTFFDILQRIVKQEADNREFWSGYHKLMYDYYSTTFKAFESDLKSMKTSEIRAKSLQLFVNELETQITKFKSVPIP